MSDEVKYYFNEDTNQILVSGSSTKSGMNTLLTSPKNSPIVNGNTTAKISSLGANLTYTIQNGSDTTTIPIADNQELWVYRGWQPVNTGDANAYRYNPHLHRPYKAYMLTETGSGITATPFSPTGFPLYSNTPFNDGNLFDVADRFEERVLGSNGSISTQDRVNSVAAFSGSFTIENQNREVHPYVFTKYSRLSPPGSGSTVEIKDSTQAVVATLVQTQTAAGFTTVPISGSSLTNGEYTFTSSVFHKPRSIDRGFTQFGLFTEYADFAEYEAINDSATDPVRVEYTSSDSDLTPLFFDLPKDKTVQYTALVGTPSFTPVSGFTNTIVNPSASAVGSLPNLFSTRVNDVYISYSSSLSQSIDGLYIFNQIPSADLQVTVSAFLQSWQGVESGFQFGETNTTYSISPDPPFYGLDTTGGEPTFPTASILIYTGSYPSAVPTILDDHYVSSSFSSSVMHQGLAVTMSTLIPSSSISLKDCLSVAVSVSSGSANSASVEQGLIVSRYELEFNTPLPDTGSDGRVPVFIENAFADTDGFENAVDCQPLYNTIVTDNTLRRNPLIQEVEYNIPETFQLDVDQRLLPSQAPFTPLNSFSFNAYVYDSTETVGVNTTGFFAVDDDSSQKDATQIEFNNRYYEGGDSSNTRLFANDSYNVWDVETNRIIRFPSSSGDLQFNVISTSFTAGSLSSRGKYTLVVSGGTSTGANSPFNDGDKTVMELLYGEALTTGASMIVSQVPLSDGTVQITTTGTGTGLELDITSINSGTELLITVSSPGRGHKDGDLLTIPQAVLTPVFGNAIVRDLEITLSFTYGLYNPSNFEAILEDTAIKSSVPESFYTQTSSIIPRYNGAKSTAPDVNTTIGLVGGFGKLPVIDYKTAYFAYCDQVIDLYPVINNKTLFNVKYLINEGGDPKQPNLSLYTAYDIQGSWQANGVARIGINQISGSTQYDTLNNIQPVYEVTKLPSPYLYSQTGATSYSTWIPLASDVYSPGVTTDTFENYSMNIDGNPFQASSENQINIVLPNVVSASNDTIVNDYTIVQGARYGLSGSNDSTVYASSSILTTTSAYAVPGEVYFNKDQFAIDNDNPAYPTRNGDLPTGLGLSDSYTINLNVEFPSTPPLEIETETGGRRTTYFGKNANESVGYIQLELLTSTTDGNTQPYNDTQWGGESNLIDSSDYDITISFNYGPSTFREINVRTIMPNAITFNRLSGAQTTTNTVGVILDIFSYNIDNYLITNFGANFGARKARYALFKFRLKTNTNVPIVAEKRYRWRVTQNYTQTRTGAVQYNKFNPTNTINLVDNPNPDQLIQPPLLGPFVSMEVQGTKTPAEEVGYDPFTDSRNFLAPFWDYSSSAGVKSLDTLILTSSIGNASYGSTIMGELNYTASANDRFPGGQEPADAAFPYTGIPWSVIKPGEIYNQGGTDYDEIRFENDENLSYKILDYKSPSENNGKLEITLDGNVPESTNKDFFLLRRYVYSPNTILIDREFPYGSLPVTKEFIPTTNTTTDTVNSNGAASGTSEDTGSLSTSTSSQSGSIVTIYKPLTKADNTPSGIIFPEYPTELIDVTPDELIVNLRDKKLID